MGGAGGEGLASARGGPDAQDGGDNEKKTRSKFPEACTIIAHTSAAKLLETSEQVRESRDGSSQLK